MFPSVRIIKSLPISPRKSRGQHFLIHEQTARKIVSACNITNQDTVVEIGAGYGALTVFLAEVAGIVIAVEIDTRLADFLRAQALSPNTVRVVTADILRLNISSLLEKKTKAILVGNIPYGITTSLFIKFLEESDCIKHAVFMVQKDFCSRLIAQPGDDAYGLLSIYMQAYATVALLCDVPAAYFYPQPMVDSTVLRVNPVPEKSWHDPQEKLFRDLAAAALAPRRKTIYNCLKKLASRWALQKAPMQAALGEAGIAAQRRGETLSVHEFYRLADAVAKRLRCRGNYRKSAL